VTSINKTPLIYRNELLPLSETFIKEQILALRDWRAVLVGRKRLDQLPLDNLDVRLIGPASPAFQDRLLWKAHKLVGLMSSIRYRRNNLRCFGAPSDPQAFPSRMHIAGVKVIQF
jgi:hypothetical protein